MRYSFAVFALTICMTATIGHGQASLADMRASMANSQQVRTLNAAMQSAVKILHETDDAIEQKNREQDEQLEKHEACGAKSAFYAPGKSGADAQGCVKGGTKIGLAPLHKCGGEWCTVNKTDKITSPGTECVAFAATVHSNYRYVKVHCQYDKSTGSVTITSSNGWGQCGYICTN